MSLVVLSPFVRFQLRLQTAKKGLYYDSALSKKDIDWFIKTYHINLDELEEKDPTKYETFNEFFYRKLKPGARPIDSKDDDVCPFFNTFRALSFQPLTLG